MNDEDSLGKWMGVGVPLLLMAGLLILFGLHSRLRLPITALVVPVSKYVGIQLVAVIGSYWAGKLSREQKIYSPIICLGVAYCWSSVILAMHYGNKWGLLKTDPSDYAPFTVMMLVVGIVLGIAVRFGVRTVPRK